MNRKRYTPLCMNCVIHETFKNIDTSFVQQQCLLQPKCPVSYLMIPVGYEPLIQTPIHCCRQSDKRPHALTTPHKLPLNNNDSYCHSEYHHDGLKGWYKMQLSIRSGFWSTFA